MKKTLFLLTAIVFVLTSCQPKEDVPTREKKLSEGFAMMDQQNYDGAISYFSDLLNTDQHFHVKMALASAYAARGGIKLQEIYSFVVVKDIPVPVLKIKGVSLDKQAGETMKSLGEAAQHWNQIPTVNEDGRADMLSGLDALRGEKEPGARLYAAVLRIVALKSAIMEGVASFEVLLKKEDKKICAKDLLPYTEWAGDILRGLGQLAMDLEISFPEQQKQYQEKRLEVEGLATQVKALKLPAGDSKCF